MSLKSQLNMISKMHSLDNSLDVPDDEFAASVAYNSTKKDSSTSKKKKKKKTIEDRLDETQEFIDSLADESFDYDFEDYLESAINSEEDENLKDSLITMGRKYARQHAIDEGESEVSKAFAPQEKELNNLLKEIEVDKKALQDDIAKMRSTGYGANRKMLSEMVNTKTQLHNTALAAIKEKNNIKKMKFDIVNKANANKSKTDESDSSSVQSSRIMQEILGGGVGALLDSVGGREEVSGGVSPSYDSDPSYIVDSYEDSDEFIQKKYFQGREETDGDKFIRYENDDVHYVLLVDEAGKSKKIIAEDKNGDIVHDYPIPSNVNQLHFDIDKDSMTASDQLNRQYNVRKV